MYLSSSSSHLLEFSSSSSTPSSLSSSSSFGNAINLFYFTDVKGNVYRLLANKHRAFSYTIFKAFSSIDKPPYGLAISYYPREESSLSEMPTSSLSSLSSSSSISQSLSSLSEVSSSSSSSASSGSSLSSASSSSSGLGRDYNVFILRKKNNTIANLSVYDMNGYLKKSMDFFSAIDYLGLSVWPNDSNLLIATSPQDIHFIYISFGQIRLHSFPSPIGLTYGIAFKEKIDDNNVDFFVKDKSQRKIATIRINKKYKTSSVVKWHNCVFSKWHRLGGMAYLSREAQLSDIIESSSSSSAKRFEGVIYNVIEEKPGYSHLYETKIYKVNSGVSTSSSSSIETAYTEFISAMPFTVYGVTVPIVGSAVSLLPEPPKVNLILSHYNLSGNFIENFDSLFMGNMKPGEISDISIINMKVEGVSSISNIKIGIVDAEIGNNSVNGVIMVGASSVIDPLFEITNYFSGINSDKTSDNINNYTVGVKPSNVDKYIESNYVYLAINVPAKYMGRGHIVLKWFFEYED